MASFSAKVMQWGAQWRFEDTDERGERETWVGQLVRWTR